MRTQFRAMNRSSKNFCNSSLARLHRDRRVDYRTQSSQIPDQAPILCPLRRGVDGLGSLRLSFAIAGSAGFRAWQNLGGVILPAGHDLSDLNQLSHQEVTDQESDLGAMRLQREVSGLDEMYLCLREIAPERFGAGW